MLPIDVVVFDEKLYPRVRYDWAVMYKYAQAMKSGAKFPPITVMKRGKEYVLIDGRHRLEAFKKLKEVSIPVEVVRAKDEKHFFIETVKRNIAHGLDFSSEDRTKIIHKLREFKVEWEDISKIVLIPVSQIRSFTAKRTAYDTRGKPIYLKAAMRHLAGQKGLDREVVEAASVNLSVMSQLALLKQFKNLLDTGMFNLQNAKIVELLKEIKRAI